jgi:hypothetical protein
MCVGMETIFGNYLASQKHIQELALRDMEFQPSKISLEQINAIQFPLKKLSLLLQTDLFGTEENLLAFLNKFTGSLEELEIGGKFPEKVYEMIFKNFRNLKVLRINVSQAPTDDAFYHNLRSSPSVKKLILYCFRSSHQRVIEGIIGNLPNLESLDLDSDDVSNELLVFISNNLLKLEHLSLRDVNEKIVNQVRIASLKSLSIKTLPLLYTIQWKVILKAFPKVEKFSVEQVTNPISLNDRNFNVISKTWKNLSHVKFGYGFVAVKRIFNQMLRNCKSIKVVEISEDSFKNNKVIKNMVLRDFKKDGLRFIIYSNAEREKVFEGRYGLWVNEHDTEDYFDSGDEYPTDTDYDSDEDFDSDDSHVNILGMILRGGMLWDSDDQYVFGVDSDGEPRHWLEDSDEYFGGYDDLD